MSTLRRLLFGLVASGLFALPMAVATPAAAEPTPTPTGPQCKAGLLTMTTPSDIAVAGAPDSWVRRSATIRNTTSDFYNGLTVVFDIWPDKGTPSTQPPPMMRYTGTGNTTVPVTLRLAYQPRLVWRAVGLKPTTAFPGGAPSFLSIELSFPASSAVTTYSTRLTLTAGVCGSTVLASSSGIRFGFMTSGSASTSASLKPSASAKASAKPSRKPSPAPATSADGMLPSSDEVAAEDSSGAVPDQDLVAGEREDDAGSPLPWLAGLGLAALIMAVGLLFWLRRRAPADDEY